MGNLLGSLMQTASALDAYGQVLGIVQNNVANASTPGWARQTQNLVASRFDPEMGFTGGVRAGEVNSSRNEYSEQSVRQQTSLMGEAQQSVNSLSALQSLFDVTGNSGIASALNNLYQSFSAWGQTPTSAVARQTVIQRATDVAAAFQSTAIGLQKNSEDTVQQLQQTVAQVNHLTDILATYNHQILSGNRSDAGLDAQIHARLEELSQTVDLTASLQTDGSYTVLMNDETPLVIGDRAYALQVVPDSPTPTDPFPLAPARQKLISASGKDITNITTGGEIGALLNIANSVLPSYLGDSANAGDLNTLALGFASRVNTVLTTGFQTDGATPTAGVALFEYDLTNGTNVARSLKLSSTITPEQLASFTLGPPEVSNGVPLALSQLANPNDSADQIAGLSYTEFFARIASNIGSKLNDSKDQLTAQQSAVVQAQNLRQQLSGVSLDEEATILVQFQRAYEANSKLISILNQLTQDTIDMLP